MMGEVKRLTNSFFTGDIAVISAGHDEQTTVTAVFSESLLRRLRKHRNTYTKDVDTLIRFGYRGVSSGKRNGVFRITKSDKRISSALEADGSRGLELLASEFDYKPLSTDVVGVKIVRHRPNGRRLVGVMDMRKKRVVFYAERKY